MLLSKLKRWWWVILLLPLVAVGGFAAWAELGPSPMSEARAALQRGEADDEVVVDLARWITFRPEGEEVSTGLVFYPGGRVEAAAYAPPARTIAEDGYLVVLVPMPLDLAILAPSRAAEIQDAFPLIESWAIGGHSLGGAMAARYVHQHPGTVDGLVLWAAHPAEGNDLSGFDLDAVSIYGTRDELATPQTIDASRSLLPPRTAWVPIEGGNHAQFGWYGSQRGDGEATISREAQQRVVIEATVALLEEID